MRPKEKAIELYNRYELLGYMGADRGTEFWDEVKKEINNL